MNLKAIQIFEKEKWDQLLQRSIYPSYRQSFEYERSKELNGRKVHTFIFEYGEKEVAGVQYTIKKSAYNLLSIADILSGFVLAEEPNEELVLSMLSHFVAFAKKNRASFVQFNSWLPAQINNEKTKHAALDELLCKEGWDVTRPGRHTYWIDLSLSEEELLKKMKRQTRYDVRQGIKSKIETEVLNDVDETEINKFWLLYKSLGERKEFSMYTEEAFKNELRTLLSAGKASLFISSIEGIKVNYSLASNFGIASYLHGALNPEFKGLKGCPSPGPLAQWEMMINAQKQGATIYDMGFCPGRTPYKEHPSYKIWRFKYGFGGDYINFLPTYGKSIHKIRGKIFKYLKYRKI